MEETLEIFLPIEVVSIANKPWHWRRKYSYTSKVKNMVLLKLNEFDKRGCALLSATFTRFGKRDLDDDNLVSAFKSHRDAVAMAFGTKDGPKNLARWYYEQETCTVKNGKSTGFSVKIHFLRDEKSENQI